MRNKIALLAALAAGFIMALCTSCSEKKSEAKSADLKIEKSEVYGDNAERISVVPGTYALKLDERMSIKVKLKLEEPVTEKIDFVNGPSLRLKTADGLDAVEGFQQMKLADGESQKMQTFLTQPAGTEQEFVFINDFSYDKAEEIFDKVKSFTLDGLDIVLEEENTETADSADADETAEADGETLSSEEVDQLLNDYEEMVDSYVSAAEKAQDGDITALADYANVLSKASSLAERLEKVNSELTPAQAQRFAELQVKLAGAAAGSAF